MPPMTSQRFLGHPARPKRQRTRFPTPGLSRGTMRAKGGKDIGWWDYSNPTGERIMSTYTDQKDLPATTRVSTAGDTGYYFLAPPLNQGETDRNVQMARNPTSMTLFIKADETQLNGVNGNGHLSFRIPSSIASAGATWGINATFGAMSTYSTPTSVTIFSGDIESNIASKSAVGLNIRGFEARFDIAAGGVAADYSGNYVVTQ